MCTLAETVNKALRPAVQVCSVRSMPTYAAFARNCPFLEVPEVNFLGRLDPNALPEHLQRTAQLVRVQWQGPPVWVANAHCPLY